jgi:predicted RNase H-like HicB family nuclease
MKAYNHRVLLTPEPKGGFTVTVPTFPSPIVHGETVDECITNAKEATEL